ncbi:family 20 glycosylhydrolase [Pengzhenrongella sicca]|uniref:beta-N-acetylhexosaminidase n=1 Tax=Pengzhenrongella sicca TaxID=2819238 RepID=A0A8A4ZHQ7_9MICO|nr:family 20 glycosylhydrolase [Pengzhenrongella sicca]
MPIPREVVAGAGAPFRVVPGVRLVTGDGPAEISLGVLAADDLGRRVGFPLDLLMGPGGDGQTIRLSLDPDAGPADADAAERYEIDASADRIELAAPRLAGLVRALATLRQLVVAGPDGVLEVAAVHVADAPRYPWRGLSLDVVRHFVSVEQVKAVLTLMSEYKFNVLHLHLTDDQGWRIALPSRPRLTERSAQSEVGGGPGGFYTALDYAELIAFAAAREITIVPEIDMPGHVFAAQHAYGELTGSGTPVEVYAGTEVGFSHLHRDLPATAAFLADVFGDLAAMTPGDYVHLGGDEIATMPPDEYAWFVRTAHDILRAAGKRVVGWQEIAAVPLGPGSVVQYWDQREPPEPIVAAAAAGARVLLSPGARVYLDMKYDASSPVGLDWAGFTELRDAYDWEPAELVPGLPPEAILGVEAAVWTETISTRDELYYLLLPRLAAVAEVAWSLPERRCWAGFRVRVAGQAPHWQDEGLAFYRSPQVDWP